MELVLLNVKTYMYIQKLSYVFYCNLIENLNLLNKSDTLLFFSTKIDIQGQ